MLTKQNTNNDIRTLILNTAYKIGLESGYYSITVRKVSKKIGYSTGVIYYHFKNKFEIIEELYKMHEKEIQKNLDIYFEGKTCIRDILIAMFEYISKISYNKRQMYMYYFAEKCHQQSGFIDNVWIKNITAELKEAVLRGEIEESNLYEIAKVISSVLCGYHFLLLHVESDGEESDEKLTSSLVNTILNGISKK